MTDVETRSYPLSERNRVKRMHERGSYDRTTVHGLLDASMLCHVSYVIEGQPYCTPTFFWREGEKLYWHGSSASRMLRNQSSGQPVCLTVAHLDSLVLARCGLAQPASLWLDRYLQGNPDDPQKTELQQLLDVLK